MSRTGDYEDSLRRRAAMQMAPGRLLRDITEHHERFNSEEEYQHALIELGKYFLEGEAFSWAMDAFREAKAIDLIQATIKRAQAERGHWGSVVIEGYRALGQKKDMIEAILADNRRTLQAERRSYLGISFAHDAYLWEAFSEEYRERYNRSFEVYCAQFGYPRGTPIQDPIAIMQAAHELRGQYDVVIAVAGGGLASGFGFQLMGWPVGVVGSHRHDDGASFEWVGGIDPSEVRGKRVLITDKDAVSGRTLARVVQELQRLGAAEIGIFFNHDPGRMIGTRLEAVPAQIPENHIHYPARFDFSNFYDVFQEVETKL